MSHPHVEAIDLSLWINDALDLSDDLVAAVEKRAHLEGHPFPRAVFAVAAATVVSYRLCHTGPNEREKVAAMAVITELMDPFMADLMEACKQRAAKAN